jgi:hypothetical protein
MKFYAVVDTHTTVPVLKLMVTTMAAAEDAAADMAYTVFTVYLDVPTVDVRDWTIKDFKHLRTHIDNLLGNEYRSCNVSAYIAKLV